jgi:hypothetical protein
MDPEISIAIIESILYETSLRQRSCANEQLHDMLLPKAPAVATRSARKAPVGRTFGHAPSSSSRKTGQHCHCGTGLIGWFNTQTPSHLHLRAQPLERSPLF